MKVLYILLLLLFINQSAFSQSVDSLSNMLNSAYTNNDTSQRNAFLEQWYQEVKPVDITTLNDTLWNIYEVYSIIYNAPEYFSWALQKWTSNKPYRLITPPNSYNIKELTIKEDDEQVLAFAKWEINQRKIVGTPFIIYRKIKIKDLKKYSDFMYFNEKYQFEKSSYWNTIRTFQAPIENDTIKILLINEKYQNAIENYTKRPLAGFDSYNDKEKFLYQDIQNVRYPIIYNITFNPEFTFAEIEYEACWRGCYTGLKRTKILLQKIDEEWQIIYPTKSEPELFYYTQWKKGKFYNWKINRSNKIYRRLRNRYGDIIIGF